MRGLKFQVTFDIFNLSDTASGYWRQVYAFRRQFFMLLCIGFRVRKKLDRNVYTLVDPCTEKFSLWEGVTQ